MVGLAAVVRRLRFREIDVVTGDRAPLIGLIVEAAVNAAAKNGPTHRAADAAHQLDATAERAMDVDFLEAIVVLLQGLPYLVAEAFQFLEGAGAGAEDLIHLLEFHILHQALIDHV
jgi:hypothetical protein